MLTTPSGQDEKTTLPEIRGHKLSRVIGSGGMSTVYLGKQVALQREVAIKVMLPEALGDETSRRRFENEARTIARLDHPHIVGIHEVGRTSDGLPYYTMPHLPRGHLAQRDFSDGQADPGHVEVRAILRDLLSALEYAHARGVVHRDVKAENVLFDEAGRPLLADFGIALRRGFGSRVTTAGLAVGSTAYMAPEQARGEEVDARADLYAVGVLAWEMLTGHLPYMADDALSMAVKHAQDPIPRLPRPLRHWQGFIDRALAKYPGKRFGSAEEMRLALDRVPQRRTGAVSRLLDRARAGLAAARHLPRAAWICIALFIAAAAGLGLRQLGSEQDNDFFRIGRDSQSPRAEAADKPRDASEAMLRPLPVSPAERWVVAANQQLDQDNLTSPDGDNAYDSLVAGWKADPSNPDLASASERLIKALARDATHQIDRADDAAAGKAIGHARDIAMLATQTDGQAMDALRRQVTDAYRRRIESAIKRVDQAAALRAVAQAKQAGVDPASLKMLQARADAVPQAGDTLDGAARLKVVRAGSDLIGISPVEISRSAYAAFAAATRRPASLCRARASLLRIVKPIDWNSPGFTQSPGQPVVCVSWGDANSYARWMSKRSGHHYRLPTAAEARLLPSNGGQKPVAEWLLECSNGCRERRTAGRSWREPDNGRALDATRGYDDVGFRLVREL